MTRILEEFIIQLKIWELYYRIKGNTILADMLEQFRKEYFKKESKQP